MISYNSDNEGGGKLLRPLECVRMIVCVCVCIYACMHIADLFQTLTQKQFLCICATSEAKVSMALC